MSFHKRLFKDIEELKKGGHQVLAEDLSENFNVECFLCILNGPKDTPYESGSWHVRFTMSNTYPFTSPSVGFIQKILHPNVDWESGSVCLDALNKNWTPVFTLSHVIEQLLPYLLTYPNPSDPLNREAAVLLNDNPGQYAIKVLEATKKYSIVRAM